MSEQIILYGDHLLTGIGESPIVNGAVVMEHGKVLCCGPSHDLFNRYPLARRVGGAGKVVIPGMIDAHQHGRGITSIQRGVPDGPLEEWLVRLRGLWPVSPYLATALAAIRLLKSGVTTAMHHFASNGVVPLHEEMAACLNAYRDVGLRVTFTFDFRDINSYVYQSDDTFLASLPPGLAEVIRSRLPGRVLPSPSESSQWIEDIRAEYTSPTIRFALGPQGADWASDALLRDISEFSQKHRMPVHTHMLETRRQRQSSLMSYGRTPVQRLSQFGLLTSDTSLAHMVWVDESDLDLLERTGACIAHNPASNLRLRSGRAPVQQMIERGIPVGIGMDGMSLSDRSEFFQDLRLFAALHFETGGDAVSKAAVWNSVYNGGAAATFWRGEIGNLRTGSRADAVVIDLLTSPWIEPLDPGAELFDRILRECSATSVDAATVNGRLVLEGGCITTVDEAVLLSNLRDEAATVDAAALSARRQLVGQLEGAVKKFYSSESWDGDKHRLNAVH